MTEKHTNCGRSMADRKYGPDTGCQCNQCRADRRVKRLEKRRGERTGAEP